MFKSFPQTQTKNPILGLQNSILNAIHNSLPNKDSKGIITHTKFAAF